MSRQIFLGVMVMALLATQVFQALAADPQEQIQSWIEQLDNNRYDDREEATKHLVKAGRIALDELGKAVSSNSPEVSWRATSILEQIGLNGDEATLKQVIDKMKVLAQDAKANSGLAKISSQLLDKWHETRHKRASEKLAKLGAHVHDVHGIPPLAIMDGGGFAEDFVVEIVEEPVELAEDEFGEVIEVRKVPLDAVDLPTIEDEFKLLKKIDDIEIAPDADEIPAVEILTDDDSGASDEVIEIKPNGEEVRKVRPLKFPEPDVTIEELADEVIEEVEIVEDFDADFVEVDFDDVADFAMAPPAIMFGGGWVDIAHSTQLSRAVSIGPNWKGTDKDFGLLGELSNVSTLNLNGIPLSDEAIRQIDQLSQVQQLSINNCTFNRDLMLRYKRRHPNVNLYARGETILGVSGKPHKKGFFVSHVIDGSGADKAGIRVGDILVGADGMRMMNLDELTIIVSPKKPGDKLSINFLREGKIGQTIAVLHPRPEEDEVPEIILDELEPLVDPLEDIDR